jgi:hypothetical protein
VTAAPVLLEDDPRRFLGRRTARALAAALGAVLLCAGLVATLAAVPAVLGMAFWVLGRLTDDPEADATLAEIGVRGDQLVLAAVVTVGAAVAGIRGGLRLLRGRRRSVLFLRRFGFDDATRVVTFAAVRTVGQSWRLVTLDDDEIVPVGASAAGAVRAGDRVLRGAGRVRGWLVRALRPLAVLLLLPWIVVVAVAVEAGGPAEALASGSFDPFVDLFASTVEGDLPFDAIGADAPGLFALGLSAIVVWLAGLAAMVALLVLALVLLPVLVLLSSTADSVRAAEQAKTRVVHDARDVELAAADLATRSRKVFAARLVVLRVATAHWQRAVVRLAQACDVTLVDVSEPTENLLWELAQLAGDPPARCVLVGERDRMRALVRQPARGAEAELLERLRGRDVLLYTTDPRGVRRFARALRARLFAAADR